MENKFFKAIPIMDGVTAISGLGGELAYLVEGADRALLIDGLAGVGSLKPFVRELTDLPVTLALTHGHVDHNGAVFEYGECYVHPKDISMLYQRRGMGGRGTMEEARLNYAVNGRILRGDARGITLADVVETKPVRTYPIGEGDVFDLGGGVKIEVAEFPGHTVGEVVFIDHSRRIAIFGDACNLNTLLGGAYIEEYKETVEKFKERHMGTFDAIYCGHNVGAVPPEMIDEAIVLCQMIMDGKDDRITADHRGRISTLALERGPDFKPKNGFHCNFMYSPEKIFGHLPKTATFPLE